MDDPREASITFEAVKIATNQNKDGFILKLAVHPNDVPESLMRSWVGSRYQVAMVLLNDEGEPVMPPEKKAASKAVQIAGMLCSNERFWDYLNTLDEAQAFITEEAEAVEFVRDYCSVGSRSELASDSRAREKFFGLVGDYENWLSSSKA